MLYNTYNKKKKLFYIHINLLKHKYYVKNTVIQFKICKLIDTFTLFQLCVQKLRILIEDSDQNCKFITIFLF